MLKISSYSLRGQSVRVKLKCTCGNNKIFEVKENDKCVYFCSKCRSRKTLEELRKEASSYWRSRTWMIECEPDQRAHPRVQADFGVDLTIRASRYSPPYCTLHGRCVVLSETGMLAVVEDFRESYFPDITSAYRFAEIAAVKPAEGLPTSLTGRIYGVRYRPDELPQCRIGVAFEDLSKEAIEALRHYVEQHTSGVPSDLPENIPPVDNISSAP